MLILSNSLMQTADEGSLKLASNLVKRIKKNDPDHTYVVSFEREFPLSDVHLTLNKFHVSKQLISILRKQTQKVLYIPFPAPTFAMIFRICVLSFFSHRGLCVAMVRQYSMNRLVTILLRLSRAEIIVFSKKAHEFYQTIVGNHVKYLKTGVDINKFVPVSTEKVTELKLKYGFDPERPIILHVGHMKDGRNVAELMKIDKKYQVLLVVSTLSKERQNMELKTKLLSCPNIRIMDQYLPNIEEIYQMCDAYFFPVKEEGHCIDVPLSCLEAAACNKPVITTDYGEMRELIGFKGFYHIVNFDSSSINEKIEQAISEQGCVTRLSVLDYDYANVLENFV